MVKVRLVKPFNHNKKIAMSLVQTVFPWIDLVWVPVALVAVEKGKRLLTLGFVGFCIVALRLQIELMDSLGFSRGYLGFMESGIYPRGIVTYGVFIAFFLLLAHFSKGSDKSVHMAASITILIAAFCLSSFIMVL